jgi:hypothetical protein
MVDRGSVFSVERRDMLLVDGIVADEGDGSQRVVDLVEGARDPLVVAEVAEGASLVLCEIEDKSGESVSSRTGHVQMTRAK